MAKDELRYAPRENLHDDRTNGMYVLVVTRRVLLSQMDEYSRLNPKSSIVVVAGRQANGGISGKWKGDAYR